jgi:hypothetical protein
VLLIITYTPAARHVRIFLRISKRGYTNNIDDDPDALAALHNSKNALQAASSPIKLIQNGVHIWSRMLRNNYRSWNLLHVPSLLAIVWDLLWRLLLVGLCVIWHLWLNRLSVGGLFDVLLGRLLILLRGLLLVVLLLGDLAVWDEWLFLVILWVLHFIIFFLNNYLFFLNLKYL